MKFTLVIFLLPFLGYIWFFKPSKYMRKLVLLIKDGLLEV